MEEAGSIQLLVSCSGCGHVKVAPDDVTIRNCVDTDDWSYWFVCPCCRSRAAAATPRPSALDAICAGSAFDTWSLPAELNERPEGPPFTFVDLIEMRLLLIEPDWIDQLLI